MSEGLVFCTELQQKMRSLGGPVKPRDPDYVKRTKAVIMLYATVAATLAKLGGDEEITDKAIAPLRLSYNEMVLAVAPPSMRK